MSEIHVFEAAGLGKAPFRFVGIETAVDRAGDFLNKSVLFSLFRDPFGSICVIPYVAAVGGRRWLALVGRDSNVYELRKSQTGSAENFGDGRRVFRSLVGDGFDVPVVTAGIFGAGLGGLEMKNFESLRRAGPVNRGYFVLVDLDAPGESLVCVLACCEDGDVVPLPLADLERMVRDGV